MADNTVSELGNANQGFAVFFEKAAVVGKVISYEADSGQYIVYGRLSTCEGYDGIWRIFQTGRFYEVIPESTDVKEALPDCLGCGVKLFGTMETGKDGRNILIAADVVHYDPQADLNCGVVPAWIEGLEPDQDWIGFGIQKDIYSASLCSFDAATALITSILPLKFVLESSGRQLAASISNEGQTVIFDPNEGISYTEADVAWIWHSDPYHDPTPIFVPNSTDRIETHRSILAAIQSIFPFSPVYYVIPAESGIYDAARAVGGYVWVEAMHGANNSYLVDIPVIRPDLDRFMKHIEDFPGPAPFSEWACPALFYGRITPHYSEPKSSDSEERPEYDYSLYEGPFFASGSPRDFLSAVIDYSQAENKNSWTTGVEPFYCQHETWKLTGLTEQEALALQTQGYAWFGGIRCLEYIYTPPDGGESCRVTLTEGTYQDDPDYMLVDHYIVIDRMEWQGCQKAVALGKGEFNFLLNCIRDMTLRGGFQ